MRFKERIMMATAAGVVALGTLAIAPGVAHAANPGFRIELQDVHLAVFDDDGGGSVTSRSYNLPQTPKRIFPGHPESWTFGGCSGPQGNGEVWTQVTVTASFVDQFRYRVHVHLDLYEDTSATCGGTTLNFPTSQLDKDGDADSTITWHVNDGPVPAGTAVVEYEPSNTLDRGELTMGWQGFPTLFTELTNVPIPDKGDSNGVAYSFINVTNTPGNAPSSLVVQVAILHTFRGDLQIDLISPDGRVFRLLNSAPGDGRDNVIQTWTIDASTAIANGSWTLQVMDVAEADTGFIDLWQLGF